MRGKDGRKQPRRGQMVDKFRGREEIGAKKKKGYRKGGLRNRNQRWRRGKGRDGQ